MDFQRRFLGGFTISALVLLLIFPCHVTAGDIVHHDDLTPKKPGCENDFILVIYPLAVFVCARVICFHLLDLGFDWVSTFVLPLPNTFISLIFQLHLDISYDHF